ncbi:MAG: leucine-rich repeat domain-containing protein [Ruminococcus sp.]|nr:leucine-rich repeat domain-containing protein [Ruminococcus sp.]
MKKARYISIVFTLLLCIAFSSCACNNANDVSQSNTTFQKVIKEADKYTTSKEIDCEYDSNTKTLFVMGNGPMSKNAKKLWMTGSVNKELLLKVENLIICKGLTSICDNAFDDGIYGDEYIGKNGFRKLKNVFISDTVKSIGERAFYNCAGLENVVIPDSVEKLGESAFELCSKLNNVTIPENVKEIPERLFCSCDKMENVTIGNSVEIIGEDAFYLTSLKSINIPDSVTTIESGAFFFTDIYKIKIPASVIKIGENALGYGADLKTDYEAMGNYENKNFTIEGYKGTAAEKYAKDNEFKFVALD